MSDLPQTMDNVQCNFIVVKSTNVIDIKGKIKDTISFFYSPTDAQVNSLKNNIKIYIKIYIKFTITNIKIYNKIYIKIYIKFTIKQY
jgi:ethanolamine utilization cobalamin adenosyltransferase